MKPLTKEQAGWLIEKIDACDEMGCQMCECDIPRYKAKEIINQCTEKEFPKFKMSLKGEYDCHISLENDFPDIKINFECDDYLDKEEFKKFTEGCNKIVEWLDEQNK